MSSVADAPMTDLYCEAEPATVTAFVADLYEARGWTVDRRGDRQLVVSDGDRETNVALVHPADPDATSDLVAWADRVVVPGSTGTVAGGVDADADVVDAATLGRQVGYALDRPEAQRLLRTHFGWTPDPADDGDSETGVGEQTNGTSGTPGPFGIDALGARVPGPVAGRSGVLLAVVVVLAVTGSVAVVVTDELGGSAEVAANSTAQNVSMSVMTPRTSGRSIPVTNQERFATPIGQTGEQFANLPPGLNQSGEIHPERLTEAHEAVLANRSYRISITYRESVNGRPTGVYTETIRVANATRYSVSVSRRGTLQAPVPSIAETDVYADGTVRYERIDESVIERTVVSYDRFLDAHGSLLGVFLDVQESSIADYRSSNGSATVYVITDGNPARLITNTTGSFDVRTDGLISRGHWTYGFSPDLIHYEDVEASFSIQVSDVGSTTVREPDWVNATDRDSTGNGSTNASATGTASATTTGTASATSTGNASTS